MKSLRICLVLFMLCAIGSAIAIPTVYAVEPVTSGSAPSKVTTGSPPTTNAGIPKLQNPIWVNSIEKLLFTIVDLAIFVGTIIAVFVFIFIGFKFVMAQGNDKALSDAKQWFLYAVIGTALLLGSKILVDVIQNTLVDTGLVKSENFKNPFK